MTTNKPRVVCHEVKAVGAPVTLKFIVREDVVDEYMSTLSERHRVVSSSPLIRLSDYEALHAECENLRRLLRRCEPVLIAHAGASHMTDGFRPRRNSWDELVEQIDAALHGGLP